MGVARLQARVDELEAMPSSGGEKPAKAGGGGDPSLPAWLQSSPKNAGLSSTLPSRRSAFEAADEAAELRKQLQEEQRKSKRLEGDVQRLSQRLNERELGSGSKGSMPHFEHSEVEFGDIIGQGGFSVVHKATWHSTPVAVKKLFDPNISEELIAEFDNEVKKLEQLRHPNVLMLLAVHRKPPALSMIMELVDGGDLYHLLHCPGRFNPPREAAQYGELIEVLESTAMAIAFLHARGIVHRDIKPLNVLLAQTLEVKLCDFGLARMKSELMTGTMQFAGTPQYMAPEVFRNQKYTELVDVFAFGTMFWEAMAVDIPFANLDPPEIKEKVFEGQMPKIPATTPPEVQSIIRSCWTLDRNLRPPMAEIFGRICALNKGGAAGTAAPRPRRPRSAAHLGAGSGADFA